MFIKELLENRGKVNLFARPRRFGKTLSMSTLKEFFEIWADPELFFGLKISRELTKQICQIYFTHPGIDVQGVLNRMEIAGL